MIGDGIISNPSAGITGVTSASVLANGVPVIGSGGARGVKTISSATEARIACQSLGVWYTIGQSGAPSSVTGTTNETVLATVTIPAGAMGPNGVIRVTTISTNTALTGTNKTLRYRLGGISGTLFCSSGNTTNTASSLQRMIWNRNSESSQVGFISTSTGSYVTGTGALGTATVNTAVEQNFVITGLLADATETITLESYLVEILFGA